jgi:hypothetical protein
MLKVARGGWLALIVEMNRKSEKGGSYKVLSE